MAGAISPLSIGFILIPDYALMSLVSAVEPLRAANHLAGQTLYRTRFYSVDGGFMASTAGGGFDTSPLSAIGQGNDNRLDLVLVVAGGNPMLYDQPALTHSLRMLNKKRMSMGGISGGAAILAKAGLLSGRRFTLHWAHIGPLAEYDPELLIERALYVIDRDRYTCAGGVAALDMMCALIAREHGSGFARDVSDWFVHPRLRAADELQSGGAKQPDLPDPRLQAVVELMNSHLADPLSPHQLAILSNSSVRHLQRLFSTHLGTSLMAFYRDLRLSKADELLTQTRLPVLEVALLTGFTSQAHFTRCFAGKYLMPPSRRRNLSKSAGGARSGILEIS